MVFRAWRVYKCHIHRLIAHLKRAWGMKGRGDFRALVRGTFIECQENSTLQVRTLHGVLLVSITSNMVRREVLEESTCQVPIHAGSFIFYPRVPRLPIMKTRFMARMTPSRLTRDYSESTEKRRFFDPWQHVRCGLILHVVRQC